ncbi:hypothetical protein Acsp07_13860 [Actinomycetospora sp. NBRC 106378]|nr:hypothetical protein Acsp07_13860 [Actinomycetospora sp. NBRC 106378]
MALAVVGLVLTAAVVLVAARETALAPSGPPAADVPAATPADLTAERCAGVTRLTTARRDDTVPVSTGGPTAVVLGDSLAEGSTLPDPKAEAFPAAVGRAWGTTTWVDAIDGTGFVNPGYCGNQTYADRVGAVLARAPRLVVVEGGLNDRLRPPAEVGAAITDLLGRLRGVPAVVVIGPVVPPVASPDDVARLDGVLRAATAAAERTYVPALDWRIPWGPDGAHPTVEGHRRYAELLLTALPEAPR